MASGHVRPRKQAAHMIASDPIKPLLNDLARRRLSTYVLRYFYTVGELSYLARCGLLRAGYYSARTRFLTMMCILMAVRTDFLSARGEDFVDVGIV